MAKTDAERWQKLMAEAQKGDQASYRQLLTEIAPFIQRILMKSLSRKDQAEDITQEVLLSVHKAMSTYDPDRPFTPWLMAILNFRRTDYLRSHYAARDNMSAPLEELDLQDVTFDGHQGEYKDIEKALTTLAPKQREVFDLVKMKGYSAKEVADKTGMSVSAVKVSVHRSLQKLKEKLG
ncbi:MAG: RNA polymerase subunit sigma-24 [Micavibrio aeruginosavorus]|uniref:RNA polymerase subunit sigma-24 n=1 Tax=Micavibrio aeruginosavorus TaxID=349221 RepID=A0A2W5FIH8_9BACT|nr:MAG: RNA polymerase subunit sigma-24 [Micavibrio aeruginosavorus]